MPFVEVEIEREENGKTFYDDYVVESGSFSLPTQDIKSGHPDTWEPGDPGEVEIGTIYYTQEGETKKVEINASAFFEVFAAEMGFVSDDPKDVPGNRCKTALDKAEDYILELLMQACLEDAIEAALAAEESYCDW